MFDIGFSEILVIAVIALIVMGPERLPQALRTFALWFGRIRQQYRNVRSELENEMGIEDVRRQLHNETIMRDLKDAKNELENTINSPDIIQKPNQTLPDDNEK
ncbi:MAG: twin-arginine translocase subunit TatB [Porticoccus sp.]|nr:twin-arginine translocase subunit TatB [Porticoccus sp.]